MATYRRILSPGENDTECYQAGGCTPPAPLLAPEAPPIAPTPAALFWQPPPAALLPTPTPIQIAHKNQHLPTLVIIVACVLATCFLLLTYYVVFVRYYSSRRRRLASAPPQNQPPPDDDDNDLQADLIGGGGGGETTHHVWYIRTVGLDEATIDKIAVCPYKRGDGLIEGTECSVCLNDFRDGEFVRLLPKCSHAFHIPCIDTWLKSHLNCPLCRAPIVVPPSSVPAAVSGSRNQASSSAAEVAASTLPTGPSSGASVFVPENSRLSESNRIVPEEETDGEGAMVVPAVGILVNPRESSLSSEESGFTVPSDLENDGEHQLEDQVAVDVEVEDGFQPVRRSVSMDWSALNSLLQRVGSIGSSEEGRKKPDLGENLAAKNRGKLENGSKGVPFQSGPLEMERSLSSGGRFFLSRFSGRARSTVLPL